VDLLVMGTHGRRGIDHAALGSVTEKVLRRSRCPVLAVRKPTHEFVGPGTQGEDPVHLRKILFCTDLSEHANRALDYALSLMTEYDAELTLLHVLESLPASADLEQTTLTVQQQLEALIPAGVEDHCKILARVRWGKPYLEIVQLALEAQADLVILGVLGRNALDLALFGSTTHRVIQLGPCPVLAVGTRTSGKSQGASQGGANE
jgi:nucleotide-binding universal stress UspA family protein